MGCVFVSPFPVGYRTDDHRGISADVFLLSSGCMELDSTGLMAWRE